MNQQNTTDCREKFYSNWSKKSQQEIEFDIKVSKEKSLAALRVLNCSDIGPINSILEIGCGYGCNLCETARHTRASYALGCDISEVAIKYAQQNYENESIKFVLNNSLDIRAIIEQIKRIYDKKFDVILLYDVLEHIPNPKTFIRELASITKCFLIKLPIEDTLLSNYILPERMKARPSANHPDGHFWEFNVNNVHHFVVSLGLIPVKYINYKYSMETVYPKHLFPKRIKGFLLYSVLKISTLLFKLILPKRIFLRIFGGGGFVCISTWSSENVLE